MSIVDRLGVKVPKLMRTLPKDGRGYPIPYIVLRDRDGKPQFTVNDQRKVDDCLRKRWCAICGKRLAPEMWLIGGPSSFFHERGAFIDTPMHEECARYALRVCPYLSAKSFRTIDSGDRLRALANKLPGDRMMLVDNTMMPGRPSVLCLGMMKKFDIVESGKGHHYVRPAAWCKVEFWVRGVQIDRHDARKLADIIPESGDDRIQNVAGDAD